MRAATRTALTTTTAVTAALLGAAVWTTGSAAADPAFAGVWVSTDTDGSSQTMTVRGADAGHYGVTYYDDAATSACEGNPATLKGRGTVDGDTLVFQGTLRCEDSYRTRTGIVISFLHQAGDTLLDDFGVTWTRQS